MCPFMLAGRLGAVTWTRRPHLAHSSRGSSEAMLSVLSHSRSFGASVAWSWVLQASDSSGKPGWTLGVSSLSEAAAVSGHRVASTLPNSPHSFLFDRNETIGELDALQAVPLDEAVGEEAREGGGLEGAGDAGPGGRGAGDVDADEVEGRCGPAQLRRARGTGHGRRHLGSSQLNAAAACSRLAYEGVCVLINGLCVRSSNGMQTQSVAD